MALSDLFVFAILVVGLGVAFVITRNAMLGYGTAGAFFLMGFQSLGISTSPNPATISDVFMGLFWLSIAMGIGCVLGVVLWREKAEPEEFPIDALGDDMSAFVARPGSNSKQWKERKAGRM